MNKNKIQKKLKMRTALIATVLLLSAVAFIFALHIPKTLLYVFAGPAHTLSGFAWSDNVGWVSHNSIDTGSSINYGVSVDADGFLRGYAWSDNIGWIQYDPTGPYPADPQNSVFFDPCTRTLTGWAKIISFDADGWVSMHGTTPAYGVSIDEAGAFHGYAWNDLIGWVQYDATFGGVSTTSTSTNQAPQSPLLVKPTGNKETWFDYPEFRVSPLTPVLSWSEFIDPNCGSSQQTYQIQISQDPTFNTILHDYQPVSSVSQSYAIPSGILAYHNPYQSYFWRVRVQDQGNLWSAWGTVGTVGEENSFRTPLHAAPIAQYDTNPIDINAQVETQFIDQSQAFGDSFIVYWYWDFGDGTIIEGMDPDQHKNPTHTYIEKGQYAIGLKVRDSDGYESQFNLNPTDVQLPLPEWQRTIPR